MKHLLVIAALLPAGIAQAQTTPTELAQDYAAAGFSRIEIKSGPTQTKVEAWSATTKIESIHDNATGAVLKTETEMLSAGTVITPGLSVRSRDKDFERDDRLAARGDDNGGRGRGRGGDDRGGKGRGSDDGPGDDRGGRGRGSDDGPGDDRGGRGRGSDDGPGDDRGGRGRGSDDGPGDDRGGRGRGSDD